MISISEIKKEGSLALKGNYRQAIVVMLIPIVMSIAVQFVTILIFGAASAITSIINLAAALASLILAFGTLHYYLNLTRGSAKTISDVFYGFSNNPVKIILIELLIGLFVFLWSLLLIIPGIIAGFRYSFALCILRDNPEIGIREALNKSSELVKGYKGQLFLFGLSFIGWGMLCFITLGMAAFYVIPYYNASYVTFYNKLCELKKNEI